MRMLPPVPASPSSTLKSIDVRGARREGHVGRAVEADVEGEHVGLVGVDARQGVEDLGQEAVVEDRLQQVADGPLGELDDEVEAMGLVAGHLSPPARRAGRARRR